MKKTIIAMILTAVLISMATIPALVRTYTQQRTRFGHTRPNGTAAGSGWHNSNNTINTRYAENVIGVGTLSNDPKDTALSIFNRWKDSAGHNRHLLFSFNANITMAFGIVPKLDDNGFVTSSAIFATGF